MTNKSLIKTYVNNDIYNKIKIIAKNDNRSVSNYLEMLLTKEIQSYEQENGIIPLQTESLD